MTKLFSVKSLAFAGAAAFALTLAAAPQVDAAEEAAKTGLKFVDLYENGNMYVEYAEEESPIDTPDGPVIYYQTAKEAGKIKEGKYTAIPARPSYASEVEEGGTYVFNFSKFVGKQTYISLSLDGKKQVTGAALKAQPKLKVKYNTDGELEFTVDKESAAKIATAPGINHPDGADLTLPGNYDTGVGTNAKYVLRYSTTQYGETMKVQMMQDGTTNLDDALEDMSILGGTMYFYVVERNSTDGTAVMSKQAKLKVSAKPKAPKAGLKLDLKKAFEWNIKSKMEYSVKIGEDGDIFSGKDNADNYIWQEGSNSKDGWEKILTDALGEKPSDDLKKEVAAVVSGDALLADVTLNLRTKAAGKKPASMITVVDLKKSADSPTTGAVTVEVKPNAKGVTEASIASKNDKLQFSIDGGEKWTSLGNGKSKKFVAAKLTKGTILARIAGESKTGLTLPSTVTTYVLDMNNADVKGQAIRVGGVAANDTEKVFAKGKATEDSNIDIAVVDVTK